ncbi:MAG: hypothetical protein ACYCUM_10640 [Solirubrobacteraceae bacterium]
MTDDGGRYVSEDYEDGAISCSADGVRVRRYYFPAGSKRIPLSSIKSVERVPLGLLTGRARIWGTANPRYWAHLDPKRPLKGTGFVIDSGRLVEPLLTPQDPDGLEAALTAHGVPVVRRRRRLFL